VKKWLWLVLLIAAGGGGLYWWWSNGRVQTLSEKTLKFAEVRRATIRDIVSATGLVEPRELVFVASETPGTVMRLLARVGDTVSEGAELAHLDDRRVSIKVEEAANGIKLVDAAITQARAALTQANTQKDAADKYWLRQKELTKAGGAGFIAERDQAEAQYYAAVAGVKVAEAGVETAQAKKLAAVTAQKEAELAHKFTRIRVPDLYQPLREAAKRTFLILERKAHEGQLVGPQSGPLFMLAGDLDVVDIHAQVAEGDVNRITTKLKTSFKVTNFDDQDSEFGDGVVKEIRPLATNEIRPQAGSIKGAVYYDAVVRVKNRKDPKTGEWLLRPGMTVSIDIIRHESVNAWRVPADAMIFKLEEAYQDAAAREHVRRFAKREDAKDWRALWLWDAAAQRVEPVSVRIGAKAGEFGIKDAEGNEILEWEQGKEPTGPIRVIIGAPPAKAPGFFDQPANVKI